MWRQQITELGMWPTISVIMGSSSKGKDRGHVSSQESGVEKHPSVWVSQILNTSFTGVEGLRGQKGGDPSLKSMIGVWGEMKRVWHNKRMLLMRVGI